MYYKQRNNLNKKKTLHCFIYVEDHKFNSFTQQQVNMLRKAGHEEMTIIYSHEDGSYKHVSQCMPIGEMTMDNQFDGIWIGVIVIIIIIILLILFGLLYLYNDKYKLISI